MKFSIFVTIIIVLSSALVWLVQKRSLNDLRTQRRELNGEFGKFDLEGGNAGMSRSRSRGPMAPDPLQLRELIEWLEGRHTGDLNQEFVDILESLQAIDPKFYAGIAEGIRRSERLTPNQKKAVVFECMQAFAEVDPEATLNFVLKADDLIPEGLSQFFLWHIRFQFGRRIKPMTLWHGSIVMSHPCQKNQ